MSEVDAGLGVEGEIAQAANMIGDHLIDQIEQENPWLDNPYHKLHAAYVVFDETGSDRSYDMFWEVLRSADEKIEASLYAKFATSAIEHRGKAATADIADLIRYIPEDQLFDELMAPEILTLIAENADDPLQKDFAVLEATNMLEEALLMESIPGGTFISSYDLLLRLGIAEKDPELILKSVNALEIEDGLNGRESYVGNMLGLITKALEDNPEGEYRRALVETAIHTRLTNRVNAARFISKYSNVLTDDEMQDMLAQIHGNGGLKINSRRHRSSGNELWANRGGDLADFNLLTSQHDAWPGIYDHARFSLKALQLRIRDKIRGDQRRTGDFLYSGKNAKRLMSALDENPDLDLDEAIRHSVRIDAKRGSAERDLYTFFRYGIETKLSGADYKDATSIDTDPLHELRDRLPHLSRSRLLLNKALIETGDLSSVFDAKSALTHDPSGIMTRVIRRDDGSEVTKVDLYSYSEILFALKGAKSRFASANEEALSGT